MTDPRRNLPSVDRLLAEPAVMGLVRDYPRSLVVAAIRESLESARSGRSGAPAEWAADIAERLARRVTRSLRPVLNATGVVLHTNLGRAPLATAAADAMASVGGSGPTTAAACSANSPAPRMPWRSITRQRRWSWRSRRWRRDGRY